MNEVLWIRSHVRQVLQDIWDVGRIDVDGDGDVPFRCGTAACWVTVLESDPIMVRVFAHAVHGVRASAKLYRELNDIQARSLSAHIEYGRGVVCVSQTISPIGLTAPILRQALDAVGGTAAEIGGLLAAMFDGDTPFAHPVDVDEDAA